MRALAEPSTAPNGDRPKLRIEPGLLELAADLRLVVGRMARRLRQRGEHGLTASLLSAMWSIERLEPVTLGDLAVAERVQPPTVSRFVARLEEAGLVRREPDVTDRRVSKVRLSARGRRLLERTRSGRTAYLARRLAALSDRELAILGRAVPILRQVLEMEG